MDFKLHAPYSATGDQPEAIRKLTVVDFPAVVVIDCEGNNLYELGKAEYLKTQE